ncbi:hypothetical protein LCGC14_1944350 [marine sediment metagenome]|uniref:Uncharacterized protein n=1 Tax=marine sediment metagenome TaxID=412755 RepID=A0A0F9FJL9_9ZZZZ
MTKPSAEFPVLREGRRTSQCKRCNCERATRHRIAAGEAGRAKRRAAYTRRRAEEKAEASNVIPFVPSMRVNLIHNQKWCCTCDKLKPVENFGTRAIGGRYSECKQCTSKRSKDWYYANTERALSNNLINLLRKKVVLKLGARCASPDCLVPGGCTDVRAIQIDHVHNDGAEERKKYGDALGPRGGQKPLSRSKTAAIYQLALEDTSGRYQLLCANCNVIKEHERRREQYRQRRQETANAAS